MAPAPTALAEIIITDELAKRASEPPDHLREKLAFRDSADDMADNPKAVLPRLVRLAMEACGAESAGISLLEHEVGGPAASSIARASRFNCQRLAAEDCSSSTDERLPIPDVETAALPNTSLFASTSRLGFPSQALRLQALAVVLKRLLRYFIITRLFRRVDLLELLVGLAHRSSRAMVIRPHFVILRL
ncbi:hypothetical protein [Bradyrhizobium sp. USDA 329]|uniref:hypothetical protein n=1 Tax=unclassified Bradyrhizobium TaxID=2631580 RepID=UPI003510EFB1